MKPFEELRVVEIAGSAAGAYAGKLFSDYGADVVLVEPRGGHDSRRGEPRIDGTAAAFHFHHSGKRSVELDAHGDELTEALEELVPGADVVLESSAPDPLSPRTRDIDEPRLVKVFISPFGSSGPRSQERSNEVGDEAVGGHLFLNGEPHREPIARPGRATQHQAGVYGFIGATSALLARETTGRGQTVEVSHHEGLASLHQYTTVMYTQGGHVLERVGNAQGGPWHPVGNYRCRDGFVALSMPTMIMLEPFLRAAGLDELADDERFAEDWQRADRRLLFDELLEPWLAEHDADEIVRLGQSVAAPVGPVTALLDMLRDRHLLERDFWRPLASAPGYSLPRGPFLIDDGAPSPRSAPSPGSLSHDELSWSVDEPPAGARSEPRRLEDGPLEGVRILDLTRVWAGPLGVRILGDLGADVIKIEATWGRGSGQVEPQAAARTHLLPENEIGTDPWNRDACFNKLNRNKRGLTLELGTEEGRAVFERLLLDADVVIENFSPRVMQKLGLGWDRLRELNPSVVYVRMPGFGSTGPHRDWLAFGPLIEASCGLTEGIGYPDSGPYRSGLAWPDPVTGMHAAAATVLALLRRNADPERRGHLVEVPMSEALLAFNGDQILEAQARSEGPRRRGNRHPRRAPQGCYPCRGTDRWIAISVETDREWEALCRVVRLGDESPQITPEKAGDWPVERRREEHDDIDRRIAAWSETLSRGEAVDKLQSVGVIAAVVADAADLVNDPHLEARGFWAEVDHPSVGRRRYPGLPIRFSETPATYRRGAPCLGQHNEEILRDLAGLGDEEIRDLYNRGVIADRPPEGATMRGIQKPGENEKAAGRTAAAEGGDES